MSYSFTARGATKDEALRDAAARMQEVVRQQPVHEGDAEAARAAREAVAAALDAPADKDVVLSCSGWVSTDGAAVRSVNVSVTAGLADRAQAG